MPAPRTSADARSVTGAIALSASLASRHGIAVTRADPHRRGAETASTTGPPGALLAAPGTWVVTSDNARARFPGDAGTRGETAKRPRFVNFRFPLYVECMR